MRGLKPGGSLVAAVESAIRRHRLVAPRDKGLVAFSGGPDSLCLLHALATLRSALDFELEAVHVDHGLRRESSVEAAQARRLAESLHLPVVVLCADIPRPAPGNVQERARHARLALLEAHAARRGSAWVALGHTAQDQAETVLMRVVRGVGLHGLGGMDYRRGLLIRPLLDVTREEVQAYLAVEGLEPLIDPTNQTDRYLRNRVRREVVPLLARENPAVVASLCRLAANCREESAALGFAAEQALGRARTSEGVDVALLDPLPRGLLSRVLRLAFREATGSTRRLERKHVEGMIQLLESRSGSRQLSLPGVILERRYHELVWVRQEALPRSLVEMSVPGVGRLPLSDGRVLWLGPEPPPGGAGLGAALNADQVQFPLTLRPPRAGDRIATGPGQTRKVARVLMDARIPRRHRTTVPLLLSKETVIWIAGVRAAFGYVAQEAHVPLYVAVLEGCAMGNAPEDRNT